jgi:hypothetical protein
VSRKKTFSFLSTFFYSVHDIPFMKPEFVLDDVRRGDPMVYGEGEGGA